MHLSEIISRDHTAMQKYYVGFTMICVALFSFQAYSFYYSRLDAYLQPFEGNDKVRTYVESALQGLWADMLIWPLLLLVVLLLSIAREKRHK
jgi:hypothetical protein